MHACVLYYNTKQFYISGLTWEQGWLGSFCASAQYDQTLRFFLGGFFSYHPRWMSIPKTHTGLQKIQKNLATSCGIKHKKLYLKSVFKSTT